MNKWGGSLKKEPGHRGSPRKEGTPRGLDGTGVGTEA